MKQLLLCMMIISIMTGCSKNNTLTTREEIAALKNPSEKYLIKNNKTDTLITKSGVRLVIPANAFTFKDGRAAKGSVQIEVNEVFTKSEMITSGVGTMSKDRLLESFGMINITGTCDGDSLVIKENKSIKLFIPNKREEYSGELFYGEKHNNTIDWKYAGKNDRQVITEITTIFSEGGSASVKKNTYKFIDGVKQFVSDTVFITTFRSDRDSTSDSTGKLIPPYYEFDIKNLGWINCDRFVENDIKTTLRVKLKKSSQPVGYLVFCSINSIMPIPFDETGSAIIENLPVGYTIDLLIIDKIKDKLVWAKKSLATGKPESVTLETQAIDIAKLKSELSRLDK